MAGSRFARRRVIILVAGAWFSMPTAAPASAGQEASANLDAESAGVRADSVRFRAGDVGLHGMLRLPPGGRDVGTGTGGEPGAGPFPAVVLLSGGGTQYLTMEPDYWAGRLATAGFATLVYHKRGTGDSGGDWASATFDDFVADAGAAIDMLRRDPRIDDRIGVMGFSQGGRLAPVVAARHGADAAVSISGPQISLAETRLWALRNALRRGGLAAGDIEHALSLWREFLEGLRSGATSSAALDAHIVEAAAGRLPAQALPPLAADYEPIPIFNSLSFDPADELARLEVPWLVMYGEHDQVVPVAASVDALRRTYAATGYTGLELVVIPGSAHGLNDASGERHELYEKTPVTWLTEQLLTDRPSAQRIADLDSIAGGGVATGIPGIAVALVRPDGSISTGAGGVADRRTGEPFTPGSRIHAGSTTKAVTAAAVLLLVDRGELALTDTLTNLVRAPVVERIPHAQRMTVLELLEHRTGLYSPNNDPEYLARYIGPERTRLLFWTADDIAGFAADPSNAPLFEPGEGQAYGDINYVLLALIVRDVSGEPFKTFVRREIFGPLGMRDSWYLSDRPNASRAHGYTLESEIVRSIGLDPALEADDEGYIDTTDAQEQSDGAAGIVTTVVDLGRFAHAVTQTDFLTPESRALFRAAAGRITTEDDGEALVHTARLRARWPPPADVGRGRPGHQRYLGPRRRLGSHRRRRREPVRPLG